jgi:Fe2+ transport system protein FeoA
MRLDEIAEGESATIIALLNNEFMLKLVEMGFYENKMLTVYSKAIGQDPICVQIGHAKIMLRKSEAEGIIIQKCQSVL